MLTEIAIYWLFVALYAFIASLVLATIGSIPKRIGEIIRTSLSKEFEFMREAFAIRKFTIRTRLIYAYSAFVGLKVVKMLIPRAEDVMRPYLNTAGNAMLVIALIACIAEFAFEMNDNPSLRFHSIKLQRIFGLMAGGAISSKVWIAFGNISN